jgi:hypothetical protein
MTETPTALELAAPPSVARLPEPQALRTMFAVGIRKTYQDIVEARGEVHTPEDTFALQRRLADALENFKAYSSAFSYGAKIIAEVQTEELIAAVGDDGHGDTPAQSLTIPSRSGDIRLNVTHENVHAIDAGSVFAVLAAVVAGDDDDLASVILAAFDLLQEVGKFEPQVSKVKAYAATLARMELDKLAGAMADTISTTRKYKGVEFERKEPKK